MFTLYGFDTTFPVHLSSLILSFKENTSHQPCMSSERRNKVRDKICSAEKLLISIHINPKNLRHKNDSLLIKNHAIGNTSWFESIEFNPIVPLSHFFVFEMTISIYYCGHHVHFKISKINLHESHAYVVFIIKQCNVNVHFFVIVYTQSQLLTSCMMSNIKC